MKKTYAPEPAPSRVVLIAAFESIRRWRLHYYQLLWFQEPKLTEPGNSQVIARPFQVLLHPDGYSTIQFKCADYPEYSFSINCGSIRPQHEQDIEVLDRCNLILRHISEEREKPDQRACCSIAVTIGCVCTYSYDCIIHGRGHIGNHD